MSTDLATLQNSLPAEILSQLQSQVADDMSRLGSTGGNDVIRIQQDKKFQLPNDELVDEFEAVIVDFVYYNEYYLTPFNKKEPTSPACFAISDSAVLISPSDHSPMKQSQASCSVCQHNQWGSAPTGNGKACKNAVRLALLPTDATMDSTLLTLKTSPTAIKEFNSYVAKVARTAGVPVYAIKTRIFFDPKESYATVRFEALGVNPIFEVTNARREEARQRLMQEPDTSKFEMPEPSGKRR